VLFKPLRCRILAYAVAAIALASSAAAQPTVQAVLNGASYGQFIAPGSAISVFGSELAASTAAADSVPLPRMLAGVTVTLDGVEMPLYFVSATQINALIPYEANPGEAVLVVTTPAGRSPAVTLNLELAAPGIFSRDASGAGLPLLLDEDFRILGAISAGDRVIFYATGLGATDPPVATGEGGAAAEPLNRVVETPEVYVGGKAAVVEFAGAAPGFAGVYQLNVVAPERLSSAGIMVAAAGNPSQTMAVPLTVPIEVSPNVLNLQSQGVWVTVHAEIAYSAVDGFSVTLNEVPVEATKADLRGEFVAKFNLDDVKGILAEGEVELTLSGNTSAEDVFSGADTIRVIDQSGSP